MLGFESRAVPRVGIVPPDGPEQFTSGTLFPMASKKVARFVNAASGVRPLVILANLSGFDGSPESMRRRQLEFGAEIGRAVVNFDGPIVFVVISRYHGGAFVVFSKALNENMEVVALEGTYASVIGGAPAAAVVFAREVDARTRKDPRVAALQKELERRPTRGEGGAARAAVGGDPDGAVREAGRGGRRVRPHPQRAPGAARSGRSTGSSRRPTCGRTWSTPSSGGWRGPFSGAERPSPAAGAWRRPSTETSPDSTADASRLRAGSRSSASRRRRDASSRTASRMS